jgi:hypothetical protein
MWYNKKLFPIILWMLIAISTARIIERVDTLVIRPLIIQQSLLGRRVVGLTNLISVEASGDTTGAVIVWSYRIPAKFSGDLHGKCHTIRRQLRHQDTSCLVGKSYAADKEETSSIRLEGNKLVIISVPGKVGK